MLLKFALISGFQYMLSSMADSEKNLINIDAFLVIK